MQLAERQLLASFAILKSADDNVFLTPLYKLDGSKSLKLTLVT